MAFQDFDHIQERRRMERERKFRKRVTIGAISAFVLVVVVAVGVFAVVSVPKKSEEHKPSEKPKEVSKAAKIIATVCNVTDYKSSCNETLSKGVQKNPNTVDPKDFLKYAMAAASAEVDKANEKLKGMKFNDKKEQEAWEYCQTLASRAKDEYKRSLDDLVLRQDFGLRNLTARSNDLKCWLSAVISYGEMCADAFPEGQTRSDMQKAWNVTKQLTDNSLALIQQFTSYVSSLDNSKQSGRRLLQETSGHTLDEQEAINLDETNGHSLDEFLPSNLMIQNQGPNRRLLQETFGHTLDEQEAINLDETNGHSLDEFLPSSLMIQNEGPTRHLLQETYGHTLDEQEAINLDETNGHSLGEFLPSNLMIQNQGPTRRLLEESDGHFVEENGPTDPVEEIRGHALDLDGFPVWMSQGHRRLLGETGRSNRPTPDITVAKDGSGNYKTISEAIKAVPQKHDKRYVIYVKEGVYDEQVVIPYGMQNLTMYGDGSQKTIITGNKGVNDGYLLHQTPTIKIFGHGFMAQSMGFRNTAGSSKHQAVAAQVQADCVIFVNCRFEGYQDTLWAATHRQFYKKCMIIGTVDFIFGDAAALFQNCVIKVRKPDAEQYNVITASGRIENHQSTGIVLQNCKIVADDSLKGSEKSVKTYFSRPWKDQGRSIIMESQIEDIIAPEGYVPYRGNQGIDTVFFAEYRNSGPGASTDRRVKWSGVKLVKNKNNIWYFTAKPFIQGDWITKLGIEVHYGFYSN